MSEGTLSNVIDTSALPLFFIASDKYLKLFFWAGKDGRSTLEEVTLKPLDYCLCLAMALIIPEGNCERAEDDQW